MDRFTTAIDAAGVCFRFVSAAGRRIGAPIATSADWTDLWAQTISPSASPGGRRDPAPAAELVRSPRRAPGAVRFGTMTKRLPIRVRRCAVAGALVVGVSAAWATTFTPAPDLDVAIPSGTPLDWKSELPTRYVRPESLLAITRGSDSDTAAPQRARPVVRSIDVVDPSDVLTLDFAGHLGFQPLEFPRITTGFQAAERPYPPLPDVDLYWRTTVALLQMMLHPARVLRLELMDRLLISGEGAVPGLEAATSLGELSDEVRAIRAAIGPLPPRPPDPIAAKDPYATMMQRFVAEELCLTRPYTSDLAFADRLVLLRDEI